jgi:hypothetical protein
MADRLAENQPIWKKRMIDLDTLANALIHHVNSCRSADVVCSLPNAVESWFRVELIPALVDIGVSVQNIDFNFTYPGTRDRADVAVAAPDFVTVFELKSFVCSADANKIAKFPQQIARLESLVQSKAITQGVAFCTFCGYTGDRVQRLSREFFSPSWTTTEIRPLRQGQPLRFICIRRLELNPRHRAAAAI